MKAWEKWSVGVILACDKHHKQMTELTQGKNRLYCKHCGSWWKTDPKKGIMLHDKRR